MQASTQSGADIARQAKPSLRVFVDGDKSTTLQIPKSPDDMRALLAQRRVLTHQLDETTDHRNDVAEQLNSALETARPAYQAQLNVLNDRIVQIERSLSVITQEIAGAAPGIASIAEESSPPADDMFGAGVGVGAGTVFVLMSAFVYFMRRRWKKSRNSAPTLPTGDSDRLQRLENGMEAIAIEVERISEGQRFVTKLLSESKGYESAPR